MVHHGTLNYHFIRFGGLGEF